MLQSHYHINLISNDHTWRNEILAEKSSSGRQEKKHVPIHQRYSVMSLLENPLTCTKLHMGQTFYILSLYTVRLSENNKPKSIIPNSTRHFFSGNEEKNLLKKKHRVQEGCLKGTDQREEIKTRKTKPQRPLQENKYNIKATPTTII